MSCIIDTSCDLFYWCFDYGNGTALNCEHRENIQCNTTLTSDPDIAGWGVLGAFVATAIFTIAIAWCQLLISHRHFGNLKWASGFYEGGQELLRSLCDLQIITGTAIIIAGYAQWSTISFYHEQLVVNYWWLTINSFWAARSTLEIRYGDQRTPHSAPNPQTSFKLSAMNSSGAMAQEVPSANDIEFAGGSFQTKAIERSDVELSWRQKVRIGCIVCSLVLFTPFQIHVLRREMMHWDPLQADLCYRYHDYSSPKSSWLWVSGVILLAIAFALMMTTWTRKALHWWDSRTKRLRNYLFDWSSRRASDALFAYASNYQSAVKWPRIIVQVIGCLFGLFFWCLHCCFFQFMSIFTYGDGYFPLEMLFITAFGTWTTFDILDLKYSNKVLLEDDAEKKWGFGQVLPLVILAMIGFNMIDAWDNSED